MVPGKPLPRVLPPGNAAQAVVRLCKVRCGVLSEVTGCAPNAAFGQFVTHTSSSHRSLTCNSPELRSAVDGCALCRIFYGWWGRANLDPSRSGTYSAGPRVS